MDTTRASLIMRLRDFEDIEAWDEFAAVYSKAIHRVAIRRGMQHVDAENLVQEVLASVAQSVDDWLQRDDRGAFRAWLFTIARNRSVDMMTRKATRALGKDGDTGAQILNQIPAGEELSMEFEWEYRRSVFQWAASRVRSKVDEKTWQAFWMTNVNGMAIEEAASALEMSTGQVYCARSRIMAKIKNIIKDYEAQK